MKHWNIRGRLSYANVASTIALFVALGGTSFAALTLPRNSVGAKQLRRGAVGTSEIRTGAVRSRDIRNGTIASKDLAARTRKALAGRTGPPGPPGAPAVSYFLVANAAGNTVAGNGAVTGSSDINDYVVHFPRSVAACALVASIAQSSAAIPDPPVGSTVIVGHRGSDAYAQTFDGAGQKKALPFTLIAAC